MQDPDLKLTSKSDPKPEPKIIIPNPQHLIFVLVSVHNAHYVPVLRIRIHMILALLDPDPDPLVRGMDPDPDTALLLFDCYL
jgi:hypothetical protein